MLPNTDSPCESHPKKRVTVSSGLRDTIPGTEAIVKSLQAADAKTYPLALKQN